MHLRILLAGIENGGHWPWPSRSFGHFNSEFQETAFKMALVYWARPAKGCYTSQLALVLNHDIMRTYMFSYLYAKVDRCMIHVILYFTGTLRLRRWWTLPCWLHEQKQGKGLKEAWEYHSAGISITDIDVSTWKLEWNIIIFIQENAFKNDVCQPFNSGQIFFNDM